MAYKKLKYWFDKELAELLTKMINIEDSKFKGKEFIRKIEQRIEPLELKDRVEAFADELYYGFTDDYQKGLKVLLNILGPENEKETGMFTEFYWIMPIAKYVEKYGLDNFGPSMNAIEEITKRNTGEYAIRPFFDMHFEDTLAQMTKWSKNPNKHVRRLSSEGIRPRLPWAKKLAIFIDDPRPIVPILNNLKDDKSRYVQKSVANCLNDILKDNYEIGKEIISTWKLEKFGEERTWIIKHSLRNLLKEKNRWALQITS